MVKSLEMSPDMKKLYFMVQGSDEVEKIVAKLHGLDKCNADVRRKNYIQGYNPEYERDKDQFDNATYDKQAQIVEEYMMYYTKI